MGTFQLRSRFVLNLAFGALQVKHWHCHQREARVCSFWQGVYSLGDPYMFSCRLWPSMLRFYCVFSLGLYFASVCVEHLSSGETFSGYVPVQKFYNLVTYHHALCMILWSPRLWPNSLWEWSYCLFLRVPYWSTTCFNLFKSRENPNSSFCCYLPKLCYWPWLLTTLWVFNDIFQGDGHPSPVYSSNAKRWGLVFILVL